MHRRYWLALALSLVSVRAFAAISGSIIDIDGKPVAGARVSIAAHESQEARRTRLLSDAPARTPLASTQSDAKGAFSFESPKQPVVDLQVFAPGYHPQGQRVERDEEIGAIVLSRAAMRSGQITAGGKPVPNATVVVFYGGYEHVVRTNEQGRYDAPDPKRARRIVVAHPDYAIEEKVFMGGSTSASELNRTLTPGTKLTGRVVGADGESGVANATILIDHWPVAMSADDGSFTIAHVPARWTSVIARKDGFTGHRAHSKDASTTIRLAHSATISGRVTAADGRTPVAGAIVAAGLPRIPADMMVETDAKGAYSLVVNPGTYMLNVSHPGHEPAAGDVSAAAGQALTRDFTVRQLARVTGVVVDDEKRPIAAAVLAGEETGDPMMNMMPMRMMRMDESTYSGADGRFSLRVAADRTLLVRATKRGMPPAVSENMKLVAGERKTGLVLTLPSGVAVSGRVTDTAGRPLSGVSVKAIEVDPRGTTMFVRNMIAGGPAREEDTVLTGSDGTYTLRVKEGTYDFQFRREGLAPKLVPQAVRASAPATVDATLEPAADVAGRVMRGGVGIEGVRISGFGPGTDAMTTTGPDGSFVISGLAEGEIRLMLRKEDDFIQEMRVVKAPSRDLVIDLTAGGRVTGRVFDKATGKPLSQFQAGISISRSGSSMSFMGPPQLREFTNDDGSFTLENVPAGAMTLVATAPGYASARLNVTIEAGKTLDDVELPLDQGVRLTGRVTGPNGAPVPDVNVRVTPSPTGNFSARGTEVTATTDASGEYTLDALEAGEETISFTHAKYPATRKQVTLKGRDNKLDVQLAAGLRVTGVVVTDSGAPVADARVEAFSPSGGGETARTNASGQFELEGLTPGRYRFVARKAGAGDGRLDDVDVSAGAPVRITMRAGATLYGRVSGLSERDLASTFVEARSGSSSASAPVDATGSYRIEGAPTGTVQVSAQIAPGARLGQRSSSVQSVELEPGGSQNVDIAFRSDITIRGRVMRNDQPLAGGTVIFFPRRGSRVQTTASTATDEGGNYSLSGLEEGEYAVDVVDTQRLSRYSTTYTVGSSATFDMAFRTGSIRGRVIDSASGEPVVNASVQLRATGQSDSFRGSRSTATDAAGTFLIDSVASDAYVITVSKEGFGNQAVDVNVTEAGVDRLEVKLSRNEGVRLRVVDARDGRPLRAAVVVYDMQGRVVFESIRFFPGESDTGEVTLPLAPGPYTAAVSTMGYASQNVRVQSPSPQTVALTPGGTLQIRSKHSERRRIRLIDANGLPYQRFGAGLPSRDLLPRPGTTTFLNVAPGTYTLQLIGANEAVLDSKQISVAEGQTTDTEI